MKMKVEVTKRMTRKLVSAESLARYILDVYYTNQIKSDKEILNLIIDTCHNTIDMRHSSKKIKDYFYSQSDLFMGNIPDIGEKGYFGNTVEELAICCVSEYKSKINNIYPKLQFAFETFSKTAQNELERMTYALFLPEYNKNVFMCLYEQAKEPRE